MSSVTAAPPRTGPLPTSVRSAVRGAARAVAATVGAVLAGLMLALPAVHLPPPGVPAGLPASAVAASFEHLSAAHRAPALPLAGTSGAITVLTIVHDVRASATGPAGARAERVVGASSAALGVAPAPGAASVVLAPALVLALLAGGARRAPGRSTHRGPAPLRGPPHALAPAP